MVTSSNGATAISGSARGTKGPMQVYRTGRPKSSAMVFGSKFLDVELFEFVLTIIPQGRDNLKRFIEYSKD